MHTELNSNHKNYHPIITKLLAKREIGPEQIDDYFSWDLKETKVITELHDIDKAAQRIITAILDNEKIGIYGDYDVDGTTSCALFYHFFQMLNVDVELFQPSRFIEGYGIHPSSIDNAIEKNVSVLITVDCGISNFETAEYALKKNIDLIITDHHKDICETMPRAFAVVNPNRRDEDLNSEKTTLAGVAVAFAVCVAVRKEFLSKGKDIPSLYPLLQLVAIGTISDLAKLGSLNKRLVRHGLRQIPTTQYPGIKCFLNAEEIMLDMLPSEKVSFQIGPMINSKGRLDHPEAALKLLISKNYNEAITYYRTLENSNAERKRIQSEVFKSAKQQVVDSISDSNFPISVVYSPEWHEGVIGIVASKLVETFEVPAVVFTDAEDQNLIKASARSAGELDLFHCLNQCSDLFTKFGGHKAAAGLSMPKENLDKFREKIYHVIEKHPLIERTVQDYYDLDISFKDINRDLVKAIEMLEPFGMGNSRPVFRMHDFELESFKILKDVHVKWTFTHQGPSKYKISGISFNYIGKWNTPHPEELIERQFHQQLSAQFTLGINRFRGNEIIQLMVDKIF